MVDVNQSDRDAAADLVMPEHEIRYESHGAVRKAFQLGELDASPEVQAFAAHRLAERTRLRAATERGEVPLAPRFDPDGFDHWAPCPICKDVEGCSHSVSERKAALTTLPQSPAAQGGGGAGMSETRQIPFNHPAQCRYIGHDFPRPYFVPIYPKVGPYREVVELKYNPTKAIAELICGRCGFMRVIDYDGNEVVRTPDTTRSENDD